MADERHEAVGEQIGEISERISAPPHLRAAVARERLQHGPGGRRRAPRRALLALAACVAAGALAAATLLGGSPAAPTLAQAAALALSPATQPAPGVDPRDGRYVARAVGAVRFPNYAYDAPWRAAGARSDTIAGRRAATVIYARGGERVGYTIVDGAPLRVPASVALVRFGGVDARVVRRGDTVAVVWRRGGHTCIVASRTAGLGRLLRFAAWRA
ncbi:MAG TPA: hypothetical protein VMT10_01915 [Solirubrobacteraceae bacterium]|nr:hypothetical protein [Solirubrobacteraceae bacterium]